jgi:hypothetical protein
LERQFVSRRNGGPPDYLNIVVRKNARRDRATAELLDILAPSRSDERTVGLGVESEALGLLGPIMIATSSNRAIVAGRISMLTGPTLTNRGMERSISLTANDNLKRPVHDHFPWRMSFEG